MGLGRALESCSSAGKGGGGGGSNASHDGSLTHVVGDLDDDVGMILT
jgi:hypothetical protein